MRRESRVLACCAAAAAALSLALAPAGRAALVARYAIGTGTGAPSVAATATGVSAAPIAVGSGLTPFGTFWNGWNTSVDAATALAAGDFVSWTLTVTGSISVDLSTLDMKLTRLSNGPRAFAIDAWVNNGSPISVQGASTLVGVSDVPTISLNPLPTLGPGDTVTFRLAAWSPSGTSNQGLGFSDNSATSASILVGGVIGAVASVPEPGAALFALLIGLLMATLAGRARPERAGAP